MGLGMCPCMAADPNPRQAPPQLPGVTGWKALKASKQPSHCSDTEKRSEGSGTHASKSVRKQAAGQLLCQQTS